jgi:hypothetical protein
MQENLQYINNRLPSEHKPAFTPRELDQAIRKANMRSAKGLDGVSTRLIKICLQIFVFHRALLQAINNDIIRQGRLSYTIQKSTHCAPTKSKSR